MAMNAPRVAFACVALLAAFGLVSTKPEAAVRVCGEIIIATSTAPTELEAKKAALDQWKASASMLGAGFVAWRLAADRVLHCRPGEGGKFACVAKGRPCTIEQAPDTREIRRKRLET
jgi:hypothetical protein